MNFFLKSSYKHLDFPEEKSIFPSPLTRYTTQVKAPVAQLDRASDYGSEGREFESSIARYRDCKEISLQSFLYLWKISLQRILSEQTPKNLPKTKQRRCQIQVHI